jgi:hypothetical protein
MTLAIGFEQLHRPTDVTAPVDAKHSARFVMDFVLFNSGVTAMRRLFSLTLAAGLCSVGFLGCSDTSTVEKKTEVSTPGGTTETTQKIEVEKSGDNPPPAATN